MRIHSRLTMVLSVLVFVLTGCGGIGKNEGVTLRVMSYNIKHGRGNDGVVNLERAAAVIEAAAPDVVIFKKWMRDAIGPATSTRRPGLASGWA